MRIEVFADLQCPIDLNGIAGADDMFDHHNGVCACGHWGAGHDFEGLAGVDCTRPTFACADFTDDGERAWKVLRAKGEAIAYRARRGRIVAVCEDVDGEDAVRCIE